MFDVANECLVTETAPTPEEAVTKAWQRMLTVHMDEDASSVGIEDLHLTVPTDERLQGRIAVNNPPAHVDLFVVVDDGRMTTPTGFLRRI